jgi:uncharacterized membrane protein
MGSILSVLISLRIMGSAVIRVIALGVMGSTVATTMTGLMPVVVSLVLMMMVVVAMVVVIENRTQCDKRDRRRNNAVIMICAGRGAGQCQSDQAANRHDSKLVGLQLFHFNLQFISTMAAM